MSASVRSRPRAGSRIALLVVLSSSPAAARAGADLQGIEVAEVHEAEHSVSIRIDGMFAAVESRQVFVNQGDRDTEIFYAFDLPSDAAVTQVEIHLPDGRRAVSSAVDSRSAFRFVAEDGPGRPDIGLLRVVPQVGSTDQRLTRYELRLYPVVGGKSAVAVLRWQAPLRYRDSRLELRIPGRGSASNRVRERLDVTWKAPVGSRGLREVRSGAAVATRSMSGPVPSARLRIDAPSDSDVVLEARPVFRTGQRVIAELATTPFDKRRGAYALTLISPAASATSSAGYERVILVVDNSRSLGRTGIAAAKALTDALLGSATPSARTEAIVFNREVRAIAGSLTTDRGVVRKGLGAVLSDDKSANGSDLGAALGEVAKLLRNAGSVSATPLGGIARGAADTTLIIIITDSVFPLDLDGTQALSRIGSIALNEARVASVVLVPDRAPLPDPYSGPLGELAQRTGGRIVTVRHGEATVRAPGLWNELAQPAPLRDIEVDWRGATVTGEGQIPGQLEAGEGAVVLGWYHGARPSGANVRADLQGRPVTTRARKTGPVASAAALPLAVVGRPGEEIHPPASRASTDSSEARERDLLAAASRAGVASRTSSLVVIDTRDDFARDRLALARKWGASQYRRFPPPAERALGETAAPEARPKIGRNAPSMLRRTGELDRGIIERLMKHHVVPRARACYDRALRRDPNLTGAVTIELEMVRGEVQDARISRTTITDSGLTGCLLDAAYATPVPQVAIGDTGEVVVVARYPLRLRRVAKRPEVSPGADRAAPDPDDPLGGIDP